METAEDSASAFLREVAELHQALYTLFPDPVDVFQDALARELGIARPGRLSDDEWRRYRVQAIKRLSRSGGLRARYGPGRGGGSAYPEQGPVRRARSSLWEHLVAEHGYTEG